MKKRALIVFGGWEGHSPGETAAIVATDLAEAGIDVELSGNLDCLLDEARLRSFDLLVPNWTMGELSREQEAALLQAVEGGTGLGGFHGGMGDAFRGSPGYQFMVGGQWVAHPDNFRDYVVNIADRSHPIVAGIDDFRVHSEQYYMHVDPANRVLATTTFEPASAPWVNGAVMPVAWTRMHGRGRVFYQSIGHGPKEFDVPEVREITRRGLVWACR
jgi:type 1 glutamine amidotransferase